MVYLSEPLACPPGLALSRPNIQGPLGGDRGCAEARNSYGRIWGLGPGAQRPRGPKGGQSVAFRSKAVPPEVSGEGMDAVYVPDLAKRRHVSSNTGLWPRVLPRSGSSPGA